VTWAVLACAPALCVPAAVWVPAASAASNGSWSVFPYRAPDAAGAGRTLFDFSARPGQSIDDAFTLSNSTGHAIHFDVYPADAYDIPSGGGFALRGAGQHNVGVGAWIHLPASVAHGYTLPARTAATVPFTVAVPADATPGDHAGGIVALDVTGAPTSGSHVQFQVRRGVGVRVYLHVLGPVRPGLAVTGIEPRASVPPLAFATGSGSADVRFDVVNTGNTLFSRVRVQAYATDAFGDTVKTFRPTVLTAVLPGSHETVTEPTWRGLPFAGPVTVHVHVTASGVDRTASSGFWVVPWLLVAVVVVAVAGVAFWWTRRRRRRRARGEGPEAAAAAAGTTAAASSIAPG
jgi:hypothetical protein